jgi:hypothetical protein
VRTANALSLERFDVTRLHCSPLEAGAPTFNFSAYHSFWIVTGGEMLSFGVGRPLYNCQIKRDQDGFFMADVFLKTKH